MRNRQLLTAEKHPNQFVFELEKDAENRKRHGSETEQAYWQGRADAARIIHVTLFDGLTFGLTSGRNAHMLSDEDVELIEAVKHRNRKSERKGESDGAKNP